MTLSNVAGIVGKNGLLRVVVTQRWRLRNHVKKGERLFVVPNLEVQEPVSWHEIPTLIRNVERHVFTQNPPANECGECRQCCTTAEVVSGTWRKEAHKPCEHLCKKGCGIYFDRPRACAEYKCLWLQSQGGNRPMPATMRPDRLGIIFSKNNYDSKTLFVVLVKGREEQLNAEEVREFIAREEGEGAVKEIIE